MDTILNIAAIVIAVLALGVAIDAYRRAGRGVEATTGRAAPAPERTPPPEFVKPAPSSQPRAATPATSAAVVDPMFVARIDALEAQVASLAAESREAPASRKSSTKSSAAALETPSLAARRVFP